MTGWGGVVVEVGEDIAFIWRARQLGHRIVLDGSVRCGHEKTVDLVDVEAWGTRRRPKVVETGAGAGAAPQGGERQVAGA
jgi:hypothetical protein